MADLKISQLTAISVLTPATDVLPVVDVGGVTKKITTNQILGSGGTATLASATITGAATVGTTLGVTGALSGQSTASFLIGTGLPLHIRNSGTSLTQIGDNGTIGAGTCFVVGSSDASLRFQAGGAEAARFNSTGNLVLKGGTTGANGVGVTFPATQVASSDANCLDDYEEGTFTATLVGGTTSPTIPVTTTGKYTKIGRLVTVAISFANVTTTGASGVVTITGLPFTSGGANEVGPVAVYNFDLNTGTSAFSNVNGSTIYLYSQKTNAAFQDVLHSAGLNRYLYTSLTYSV